MHVATEWIRDEREAKQNERQEEKKTERERGRRSRRRRREEGKARIHGKEDGGGACGLNVLDIEYK